MEKIIILDFGSQYTQLIGRRVREQNVYCEIHPYNKCPEIDSSVRGVILSGSPASVRQEGAPAIDLSGIRGKVPVLGVCYGAQYLVHSNGGEVEPSATREYGRAIMTIGAPGSPLFLGVSAQSQVWMSHGDTIVKMPANFRLLASTETVPNAAFKIDGEETYGIQFHPDAGGFERSPALIYQSLVVAEYAAVCHLATRVESVGYRPEQSVAPHPGKCVEVWRVGILQEGLSAKFIVPPVGHAVTEYNNVFHNPKSCI